MLRIGFIFWLCMLFWLIFGVSSWRGWIGNPNHVVWGNSLFFFILFFLLGWKVFGFPVSG